MHGNRKLCRIFLGKCIGAPTQNLTTKKPPSFATRGLFFWPIILLLVQAIVLWPELVTLRLADYKF